MDIKVILEQAKAQIKAEEEREVEIARQKVAQEIAPKHQELEQLKAEKTNELTISYQNSRNAIIEQNNQQLVALQEKYENDKNKVAELIEKKKTDIFNTAFANATYEITAKSGKAIAKLESQIDDLKE